MQQASLFDRPEDAPRELLPFDGSALLYPDGIERRASEVLFDRLFTEVRWEQHEVQVFGRSVPQPRLVAWFGDAGAAYTYSGLTLHPSPWLPCLLSVKTRCEELAGETFNSALANLYRDGRDTVAWHADDESDLGPDPVIASVSLGAERRFDFRHRGTGETVRTLLPSGSIVVMAQGCQRHWRHQVPRMRRVRDARINLTFRRFGS